MMYVLTPWVVDAPIRLVIVVVAVVAVTIEPRLGIISIYGPLLLFGASLTADMLSMGRVLVQL